MSLRVLILGGHSNAALESAQSLGRRGACVAVASEDYDCLAFRSKYVAEKLRQPAFVPAAGALDWLRDWDRARNFDLIIPSNDVSLEVIRALDEADTIRAKAAVPGNAALDVALDKQSTYELARDLGIPVPGNAVIPQGASVLDWNRYPVVLKSTRSRVAIDGEGVRLEAQLVTTPERRRDVLERWLPHVSVQQQQYVPGHGFGIEMLFDRGRPVWHFAHERIHELPLTGGGSTYRRSIAPPPGALEMAERMLRGLSWHGVAMVEFRGSPSGAYWLMEINPRLWGSLALSIDCGVDFPRGLALLAQQRPVPPQPRYRVGRFTRDLLRDSLWQLENLRADRGNPLLLTRSPRLSLRELIRPLLGRESWDYFDWHDLRVTARMLRMLFEQDARMLTSFARKQWRKRRALAHHRRVMKAMPRRGRPVRVLFVCYGNICRSPIAMHLASRRLEGVEIDSAGFHNKVGRASPAHVRRAAASSGLDLMAHQSRRLTAADVERSDLILCMDAGNLQMLQRQFPASVGRSTLLGLLATPSRLEIADPYSLSEAQTREIIMTINSSIEGLCSWLESLPAYPAEVAGG